MSRLVLLTAAVAFAAMASPVIADEVVLITGAAGASTDTGQDASDSKTPQLPVVYEDAKQ